MLIDALTDSELQEVMEEMYIDDTVDVLEEMPANVVDRLLLVTDEERESRSICYSSIRMTALEVSRM